jgi:glutaredoxin-related protein
MGHGFTKIGTKNALFRYVGVFEWEDLQQVSKSFKGFVSIRDRDNQFDEQFGDGFGDSDIS